MNDKRQKAPEFASPKGTFVFPKLNTPDTKFKQEGEYSVKLRLKADAPETKAFIAKLSPLHQQALSEAKERFDQLPIAQRKKLKEISEHPLFTEVFDKDTEEPTGEIEFKFKMKASGISKKTGKPWTRKPVVFDAKGNRMANPPAIWGGTIGRVSFEARSVFIPGTGMAGLTLALNGVKIIDLVTSGGGRSADSMGLGGDEGDFEYQEDAMATDESAASTTGETAAAAGEDF